MAAVMAAAVIAAAAAAVLITGDRAGCYTGGSPCM